MKNVLYLGSKKIGYECLLYLLELVKQGKVRIVGILTNKRALFADEILKAATDNKIPVFESEDDIVRLEAVDLLISVQYHKILRKEHFGIASLAINYHMAPLPEYRGCNQFSFALYDGVKEFGTTVHRLEEGVDSGAIIEEIRFKIEEGWDVADLYNATYHHTIDLFKRSLNNILNNKISFIPQQELVEKRSSKLIRREDINKLKQLSPGDTIPDIVKKVKATSMPGFEPAFFIHNGEKYYVIPEKHYSKK